jgi:hypothetical protein
VCVICARVAIYRKDPKSSFGYVGTVICVPYVQLTTYVLYHVSPRESMCYAYVSTLICMLSYTSQLIHTYICEITPLTTHVGSYRLALVFSTYFYSHLYMLRKTF